MSFLRGRMNRANYWLSIILVITLTVAFTALSGKDPHVSEVVLLMLVIPRLHDIDRTGWIAVGVVAFEIAATIGLFAWLDDEELVFQGMGFVTLAIAVLMIWLGSIPGDRYGNRYGDAPKPGIFFRKKATR